MILQKNSPPPAVPKKKRRIWPYVAVVFLFFAAAAAGALFASTSLLDKEAPQAEDVASRIERERRERQAALLDLAKQQQQLAEKRG